MVSALHLTIIFTVVDIIVIKLDMVILAEISLQNIPLPVILMTFLRPNIFFLDLTVIDLLNVRKVRVTQSLITEY